MIRLALVLGLAALLAPQERRFVPIDVFLDTGDRPLAAYQIEVTCDPARGRIVGVEGGEPAAYAEPPFHDPAALQGGRILLAAFTTDPTPPAGRIRVARLHIEERGPLEYASTLAVAASPGGKRFEGKIELVRAGEKK